MHIRIVTPVIPTGLTHTEDFEGILPADVRVDFTELEHGPASVESAFDEMLAAPDVVAKIIEAEAAGADAVVIDCMEDPGLAAAREVVSIPVLGPCQTTMNLACTLGHRFSVMAVNEAMGTHFETKATVYGARDKYASTRSVNIPVAELRAQSQVLRAALLEQATLALTQDRADTIIIGCTGMEQVADTLKTDLLAAGFDVPVLDPIPVTMRMATLMVDSGLSHSKQAYTKPKTKQIGGFEGSSLKSYVTGRAQC